MFIERHKNKLHMNCYAMSKTNKNTRTLRKYIWRIWQSDEKPKPKTQKRNLNALHVEFAARVQWTVDPFFSASALPTPSPCHTHGLRKHKKNCSDKTNVPRSVGVEGGTEGNLKLSATFKTSFHRVHKSPSQSWHLFLSLIRNPPPPPQFSSSLLLHCLISSSL